MEKDKVALLAEIQKNVKVCQKCRLYKTAHNPVPGEGNPNSEIVFIGEAPGATEDATGRPFVGRAGKLLDALLALIQLKREDVWIGNVIKHRPPENRDPLPDEIEACMPYLTMQLAIMKPKVIITLGRYAMNYFHKDGKISRDHGRAIVTPAYVVFPLYHPAAALRNPDMARALKEDFLKIPGVLEQIRKGSLNKKEAKPLPPPVAPKGQMGLNI